MNSIYYVKSLEDDFVSKTLKGKRKLACQSADNMISTGTIKPNTLSFGRSMRLSCTILSDQYTKTYRRQGVIFQTDDNPDYVMPFDLALLTEADSVTVDYYKIRKNLHAYYTRDLIKGFEGFMFHDFRSMTKRFASPEDSWTEVNEFRKEAGYRSLPRSKYKLVEYNEAVFHSPVKSNIVAIFGKNRNAKALAEKNHLLWFPSAEEFYRTVVGPSKGPCRNHP
jgi:hypothetical protein